MNSLGCVYNVRGEYEKAEITFRKAQDFNARAHGDKHAHLFVSLNLGNVLHHQGRYDEAERLQVEVPNIARQKWSPQERLHSWGPEGPWTLSYTNALAETYRRQGRYSEAEELYDNTLASLRRLFPKDPTEHSAPGLDLACCVWIRGISMGSNNC